MADITSQDPLIEEYELGLIDETGKLRILTGKHFLTLNCLRLGLSNKQYEFSCQYPCSHFSGPMKDTANGVTAVRLMCSGRTLHFKKFINFLAIGKSNIDFSDMTEEEIIKQLGLYQEQR